MCSYQINFYIATNHSSLLDQALSVGDGGGDAEVADLDGPAQQPLREGKTVAQAEVRILGWRRRGRGVADVLKRQVIVRFQ